MPRRSARIVDRRRFLQLGGAAVASMPAALAVRTVRGHYVSAGGKLRTAHVGVGGMGGSDLRSLATHPRLEVAALCDVDATRLAEAAKQHPQANTYRDYREMIAALGDKVDAVVVSTPDHTHAPAAMAAMQAGKHVYCQKPLTHEVAEARAMRELATAKGVVTQMGIQVHASEIYRRAIRMIQSGAIGRVSRVLAWSNKNWGYDGGPFDKTEAPPATLDWNLWLGTAAERRYSPGVYHPGQWRKLIDFGTGTLGDMGVHIFDTPYAALELTFPKWVKTSCRTPTGLGHPEKNKVEYEFPGTKYTTDSLSWIWSDGDAVPKTAADVPELVAAGVPQETELPRQASLFVGEEGVMLLPHTGEAILYPEKKFADYKRPEVEAGNHYHEWVDACLGKGKTNASFDYAGPLTEALLLGVVANRFPDTKLEWDAAALKVTNVADANKLLRSAYRTF